MPGFGRVPLNIKHGPDADTCAPGHKRIERTHHWCIYYAGRTHPTLPKGEHGKGNPEIEIGQIKKMARHLEILGCARAQIAALK